MVLKEITLQDFRNCSFIHTDFGPSVNILIGNNAQGKTNILESIFTLATGKSFRTTKDADMIRWGADEAAVSGLVLTRLNSLEAEVRFSRHGPKTARLGGNVHKRLSDYVGNITVVTFSPEDLQLAKGSPVARRRFLDMLISQADKGYCRTAGAYSKILQQRNAALKAVGLGHIPSSALEPWTEQLVCAGARLVARRLHAIEAIAALSEAIVNSVTSGAESLNIVYQGSAGPTQVGFTVGQIAENMSLEIARRQREEIARGMSLVGPHRDDFSMVLDGFDLRTYGSQGQQKSVVLSLKLAEVQYLRDETGDYPILLLDDVMSELDQLRQSRLLTSVVGGTQAIITTTDLAALGDRVPSSTRVFAVSSGHLAPVPRAV